MFAFQTILLLDNVQSFLLQDSCQLDPHPCGIVTIYDKQHLNCSYRHLDNDLPRVKASVSVIHMDHNNLTIIRNFSFQCLSANDSDIYMSLNDNQIHSIENDAFEGLEKNLTVLNLANNKLTSLPSALVKLASLQQLFVTGNPIAFLDAFVMVNIGHTLNFFAISLSKVLHWPTELKFLKTLQHLHIHDLPLQNIPVNAFHGFENTLQRLYVINSKLLKIPSSVCDLQSIIFLKFENNMFLDEVSSPVIQPCTVSKISAAHFVLSGNNLAKFPNVYDMFHDVYNLHFEENKLHIMNPDTLHNISGTYHIYLRGNYFKRIPSAINLFRDLTFLDMSNNSIESVEDNDIYLLEQLFQLDLSDNPIEFITFNAFKNNRNLFSLNLSNTKLNSIPGALMQLPNLRHVSLDGLNIECTCDLSNVKTWNISNINFEGNPQCYLSSERIEEYIKTVLPHC